MTDIQAAWSGSERDIPGVILASRSGQRRQLLQSLLPNVAIEVQAPGSAVEETLNGLTSWPEISARLRSIAAEKAHQVAQSLGTKRRQCLIIAADTTIVVSTAARSTETAPVAASATLMTGMAQPPAAGLLALEQPPETEDWQETVRDWFLTHYAGKTHWAATALQVTQGADTLANEVVTTAITFRADVQPWLKFYLSTEESRGKAGGYAIQGAGSLFVTSVTGSLSNVIGLPLERLSEVLQSTGLISVVSG